MKHFRLKISHSLDFKLINSIFSGNIPACIFTKKVETSVCKTISERFSQKFESKVRSDIVPGTFIGSYHYDKTLDSYFSEVQESLTLLNEIFNEVENPLVSFIKQIKIFFQEIGVTVRPAQYKGRTAGTCIIRRWTGTGKYLLKPHEDIAQLTTKEQKNFEIQEVAKNTVVGVNICVKKHRQGGDLIIWNKIPSIDDRKSLGLEHTGYPYPSIFYKDSEKVTVSINSGDIYLVNGNHIHAVTPQEKGGDRITLSLFMGFIDKNTIVYWT